MKWKKRSVKRRAKLPLWLKVILSVLTGILVIVLGITFYVEFLYSRMHYETEADVVKKEEIFEIEEGENTSGLDVLNPEDVAWGDKDMLRREENVINILIAGEEGIFDDRGRTDAILIGTLNLDTKSIKLTSLMRDTYVQIPGYSDNKLNAAYHSGGMPLMVETIEHNFDLKIDGYVLVDFDAFEYIIDRIGGVTIKLSQTEADYLNTTNYISEEYNRNVYAGNITLNGNQALGYARVRHVPNGNQSGDFGRTQRHRILLNAVYKKMMTRSLTDILNLLPEILGMVTTNLTKAQCIEYATALINMGSLELETLRLPVEGAYKITSIRGMSVVLPVTMRKNVIALHDFIFEEDTLGEIQLWKMEKQNKPKQLQNTAVLTAY